MQASLVSRGRDADRTLPSCADLRCAASWAARQALNSVSDTLLPLWQDFTSSHETADMTASARLHERTGPRVVDRVKKLASRLSRHSFTTLCRAPAKRRAAGSGEQPKRRRSQDQHTTARSSPRPARIAPANPLCARQYAAALNTAVALGTEAVHMQTAASRLERELATLRPALARLWSGEKVDCRARH